MISVRFLELYESYFDRVVLIDANDWVDFEKCLNLISKMILVTPIAIKIDPMMSIG